MKERGMIFNAEMVRAILDGRKTQTRRIMKVQPSEGFTPMNMSLEPDYKARWYTPGIVDKDGYLQPASKEVFGVSNENEGYSCPFGAVGDRIWVRETSGLQVRRDALGGTGEFRVYRASNPDAIRFTTASGKDYPIKWTPSIHMPRWASRITLEITDVRVERLNDISEGGATAEGVPPAGSLLPDYPGTFLTPKGDFATAKVAFQRLWESIYGEENWQDNPWVWVIEFKRVEGGAA